MLFKIRACGKGVESILKVCLHRRADLVNWVTETHSISVKHASATAATAEVPTADQAANRQTPIQIQAPHPIQSPIHNPPGVITFGGRISPPPVSPPLRVLDSQDFRESVSQPRGPASVTGLPEFASSVTGLTVLTNALAASPSSLDHSATPSQPSNANRRGSDHVPGPTSEERGHGGGRGVKGMLENYEVMRSRIPESRGHELNSIIPLEVTHSLQVC